MPQRQQVILIADDNDNDVLLIKLAFQRAGLKHPIQSVSDGADCISYLHGIPPYDNRTAFPFPSLLLLDLKLPRVNGLKVLQWTRRQPELQKLCVVMLTGSDEPVDMKLAYRLGANSFLVKPLDFNSARELSESLQRILAKLRAE